MALDENKINEEDLLARARRGDRAAFGVLVTEYQDRVYALAYRTLGDPHSAEDAAQDAFIRAWRALPRFKGKSKFSSWLYRITVNVTLSELRRRGKPVDSLSDEELQCLPSTGSSAARFESSVEEEDLITRLLRDLPPVYRTIVVLFYQQGLDIREIAQITDRPVGTVKAYLHRARNLMRSAAERLMKTSGKRK